MLSLKNSIKNCKFLNNALIYKKKNINKNINFELNYRRNLNKDYKDEYIRECAYYEEAG